VVAFTLPKIQSENVSWPQIPALSFGGIGRCYFYSGSNFANLNRLHC
jgi:hypothetical protein